ncbi:sodium:proton antiporter [soil metagenome]
MGLFDLIAILIVLAALFSYINWRFVHLPTTIGVMLISLAGSLILILMSVFTGGGLREQVARIVTSIDFNQTVLHGMLAFLLFAGALHLNVSDLTRERGAIFLLAIFGTVLSTFIVGGAMYFVLKLLTMNTPFIWCLLFGALISPTDPIAVLGIMKNVGAPKSLEVQISGESLFNDGVGVVIFLTLLEVLSGHGDISVSGVGWLLMREVLGGAALGLFAGVGVYYMLRKVDNYQVEVLLTLALATGLYALADRLHMSAPIAVVIAGIFIGNHGRSFAMSDRTRDHLDSFWELIDEILNAVLFLLIGMELLVIHFRVQFWLVGLFAIPLTLGARFVSVALIVKTMHPFRDFENGAIRILTWGGLRGGISVALALSLPREAEYQPVLLAATYMVVVFSVFVQGLTIGPLIRRTRVRASPAPISS